MSIPELIDVIIYVHINSIIEHVFTTLQHGAEKNIASFIYVVMLFISQTGSQPCTRWTSDRW